MAAMRVILSVSLLFAVATAEAASMASALEAIPTNMSQRVLKQVSNHVDLKREKLSITQLYVRFETRELMLLRCEEPVTDRNPLVTGLKEGGVHLEFGEIINAEGMYLYDPTSAMWSRVGNPMPFDLFDFQFLRLRDVPSISQLRAVYHAEYLRFSAKGDAGTANVFLDRLNQIDRAKDKYSHRVKEGDSMTVYTYTLGDSGFIESIRGLRGSTVVFLLENKFLSDYDFQLSKEKIASSPAYLAAPRHNAEQGFIGVRLEKRGKELVVSHVFTGSPAAAGGLREDHRLLKVNAVDVSGLTVQEALALIRQSPVPEITFKDGNGEVKTVPIKKVPFVGTRVAP